MKIQSELITAFNKLSEYRDTPDQQWLEVQFQKVYNLILANEVELNKLKEKLISIDQERINRDMKSADIIQIPTGSGKTRSVAELVDDYYSSIQPKKKERSWTFGRIKLTIKSK